MDDFILNVVGIVNDVLRSRLFIELPDIFKSTTKAKIVDDTLTDGSSKKKRTLNDNKKCDLVRNDDPDDELKIKDEEDFKSVFGGINVCHRVEWNGSGTIMCPRWHSKHFCFDNCRHKDSHIPKSQVPGNKKKEYKVYL